jgi:hypothetical protein
MDLLMGVLLVLGLMTLIFLGPEWLAAFIRPFHSLRKAGPHH